ncbi:MULTISPECIES: copper homeostasis periplasmic binding protein CopC [unclassified Sphingomonas]|uniref:copper homeostasis periplasmic binding protein CopC n=1 Tax=Sphingomonas TaxID=13687 RepID=UPI00095C7095|nr:MULTISPECIES: copper homeostasis periplasmic binding protein CopC [unclassified Sphingomonas]MBN8812345.1 copper homeostasis periplasmic binding protein CopC [Sphingomonas sp.]OJY48037.1 MAG: copper resistance protein CopC [Sphingomonas sp. 67-41]
MKFSRIMGAAVSVAIIATASPAMAHPKLVSSTPAAQSVVSNVKQITLTFSERLMPQLSGIDLSMTGMPGMANHKPMKVTGFKISVGPDGKTLVATLPKALPAGTYQIDWHAVSADTHRITGKLTFTVK